MASARDIANTHAERLRGAFGDALTPAKAIECGRVAEMLAIADAIRTRIVDEGIGDFTALERAEDMAARAVQALGTPKSVNTISIEYVASDHPEANMAQVHHLEEQLALAHKRIAVLEGTAVRTAQEPQAAESIESDCAPAGATEPSNVLAFDPRGNINVGNGSCAIDAPLSERYPSLKYDPPVGRW